MECRALLAPGWNGGESGKESVRVSKWHQREYGADGEKVRRMRGTQPRREYVPDSVSEAWLHQGLQIWRAALCACHFQWESSSLTVQQLWGVKASKFVDLTNCRFKKCLENPGTLVGT